MVLRSCNENNGEIMYEIICGKYEYYGFDNTVGNE